MIAFYFVSNLKGNGLTTWVVVASGRTYAYMILNPSAFDEDALSQLLTERERSAFRGDADVDRRRGEEGSNGIIYSVSHECTHAFDFARGLTPFTEPGMAAALGMKARPSGTCGRPIPCRCPGTTTPRAQKLHFYGFGAAALDAAEAPAVAPPSSRRRRSRRCTAAGAGPRTPPSSTSLSTSRMTSAGRCRLICGGKVYEPMSNPRVEQRAQRILAPMVAAGE